MTAKVDYSGRTVDLLLLKTVQSVPVSMKRVSLDISSSPMIVSGIEKLVQRYSMFFLTKIGSCGADRGFGTNFLSRSENGRIYDIGTLSAAASEANGFAYEQILDADNGLDTPPDESLLESRVIDVQMDRQRAEIMVNIRLTTRAGTSWDYIIPVETGIHI